MSGIARGSMSIEFEAHFESLGVDVWTQRHIAKRDRFEIVQLRDGNGTGRGLGFAVVSRGADGSINRIFYESASILISNIPAELKFAGVNAVPRYDQDNR